MRILLVTDWPKLVGGIERHVELVAGELERGGDEVRVLTSGVGTAAGGRAQYVAYGTSRRSQQAFLQVWNPSAARTARFALRDFRPDAVHLNMFFLHLSPSVMAPLRGVPSLLTVHDYKPICLTGTKLLPDGSPCHGPAGVRCRRDGCVSTPRLLREAPRYGLFRAGLRHVDRVHAISRWIQGQLRESGIASDHVEPPVSLPGAEFVREPAAQPLFVYAGRLAPVKGVDVLLHAFARLHARVPDARLRMFGDGPDRAATERLIWELGLSERIELRVGMGTDWLDELQSAWALVTPSVFREPLGMVALEAVVRGVPVIATDGGGLAETVRPGVSGLLVPHADEEKLAAAMLEVAEQRCFRDHSIAEADVTDARRRHDPVRHAANLRATLAEICNHG